MPVEGGPADADDLGDVGQMHPVIPHPLCLGEFRRRHLRWPALGAPPGRGRGETDLGAFPDQISFLFCESTEDGDEQFATGGGGIDGFGPRFESDTAGGEIFHRLREVGQ